MSTQTQLASLRGALEAARLREEKHKVELERCTKELETLRWENVNSRRGEVEVGILFYCFFLKNLDCCDCMQFCYETLGVRVFFIPFHEILISELTGT